MFIPLLRISQSAVPSDDSAAKTAAVPSARRGRWAALAALGLTTLAFASDAFAYSGVGNMANNVSGNIQDGVNLLLGAMFTGGLGLSGYSGLRAWEAHKSHGQGQAKWSHSLTLAAVGAGLMALPALAYHFEGTIFHSNTGVQVQTVQMGGPYNGNGG